MSAVAQLTAALQNCPAFLVPMTSSLESPLAGPDGRQKSLRLCEHCEMMGVSSVIWADLETQDVIYCAICKLKFSFFTEGSRMIVTKVESTGEDRKNA